MVSTIAVEDLRVGMYVHLEGGWLSHPFPRSAFRIGNDAQLAILRGLGLNEVQWSPDKSALDAVGATVASPTGVIDSLTGTTGIAIPAVRPAARPDTSPAEGAQCHALQHQCDALQRCERRYGDAARSWRNATAILATRPDVALQCSQTLAQGMLDELLVEGDVAIRLVHGTGGDRTAAHALNVSVMAMLIGRTLALPANDLLDLGVGALLHDIGKLDLPERQHHADDPCSPAETAAYRDHVAQGVAQGHRLGLSAGALAVIAQHHEHADGSGFPHGLTAEQTTTPARIVAIVNRYDKLCNPLSRVQPLTPHEAVSTLFAQGRSRFDAALLSAFIRMIGVYPAGSLVQLTDDRYALVVGVNSSRPLKPRVLVHDPKVPRDEALLLNLEQAGDLGIRRSLVAAKLPPAALAYLDPRPRVAYYFETLTPGPAQPVHST